MSSSASAVDDDGQQPEHNDPDNGANADYMEFLLWKQSGGPLAAAPAGVPAEVPGWVPAFLSKVQGDQAAMMSAITSLTANSSSFVSFNSEAMGMAHGGISAMKSIGSGNPLCSSLFCRGERASPCMPCMYDTLGGSPSQGSRESELGGLYICLLNRTL